MDSQAATMNHLHGRQPSKTRIAVDFSEATQSATISIFDETGNGRIVMSGPLNGGYRSDTDFRRSVELLKEMVANMNAYREANGYDLLPLDRLSWLG